MKNLYETPLTRPCSTQVIVAALNEEQGIGLTLEELKNNLISAHILVVDGHSSDRTVEVELNSLIQKKGFKTIEVPIQYRERLGEKKLKMKDGATILKRIMIETIF